MKSVELERLTAEGQSLIERRDVFELMRDQAADHYERQIGSAGDRALADGQSSQSHIGHD